MSNPLFLSNLAAVKAELRLSGVPAAGEDANTILEDVLLQVRTGFYRRLGITRVGQIVAFTANYTNPTTEPEILRALAKTVEVKWAWCLLGERLPQLWMDDSGGAWQAYNEQGTYRKMGLKEREAQCLRYRAEIEDAMQILAGEESLGDETGINCTTFSSPLDPKPELMDTVFPPSNPTEAPFPLD